MIKGRRFQSQVSEAEIVVVEEETGHSFRFSISPNGAVSLHGSRIEANRSAQRKANRLIFEAYGEAQAAYLRFRACAQK